QVEISIVLRETEHHVFSVDETLILLRRRRNGVRLLRRDFVPVAVPVKLSQDIPLYLLCARRGIFESNFPTPLGVRKVLEALRRLRFGHFIGVVGDTEQYELILRPIAGWIALIGFVVSG